MHCYSRKKQNILPGVYQSVEAAPLEPAHCCKERATGGHLITPFKIRPFPFSTLSVNSTCHTSLQGLADMFTAPNVLFHQARAMVQGYIERII